MLIGIVCYVGIVWFEFIKIKCARIILHVKWSTCTAAKLEGFTVPHVTQSSCVAVRETGSALAHAKNN